MTKQQLYGKALEEHWRKRWEEIDVLFSTYSELEVASTILKRHKELDGRPDELFMDVTDLLPKAKRIEEQRERGRGSFFKIHLDDEKIPFYVSDDDVLKRTWQSYVGELIRRRMLDLEVEERVRKFVQKKPPEPIREEAITNELPEETEYFETDDFLMERTKKTVQKYVILRCPGCKAPLTKRPPCKCEHCDFLIEPEVKLNVKLSSYR